MNSPRIVSQAEWLEARKALMVKEKELTRLRDQLAAERRALPWVKVEKQYVFDAPQGRVTLADLFDGRSQLFVKHFMMGPGQVGQCVVRAAFLETAARGTSRGAWRRGDHDARREGVRVKRRCIACGGRAQRGPYPCVAPGGLSWDLDAFLRMMHDAHKMLQPAKDEAGEGRAPIPARFVYAGQQYAPQPPADTGKSAEAPRGGAIEFNGQVYE